MLSNDEPTQTAMIAPARYWPWPPMLNRPQRNANATASPTRISVVVRISVCWRLKAASEPVSQGIWKNQMRPEPSKIARYVLIGFFPVVMSTTTPPITNARSTVSSGATAPPARCASAMRDAKLSPPSSGGGAAG